MDQLHIPPPRRYATRYQPGGGLVNAALVAVVFVGAIVTAVALREASAIAAPTALAIVIGLMFSPVAARLEAMHVPPSVSSGMVVLLLFGLIAATAAAFAGPIGEWVERAPRIWDRLREELANWREPLATLQTVQEQVKDVMGDGGGMAVTVEDGGPVTEIAVFAPGFVAQILVFLAAFYFFLATRAHIRTSILALCVSRTTRWRMAHVFRSVERKVSRYLLSLTLINVAEGLATFVTMWAIGMPSPALWGLLAALVNYIPFVGPIGLGALLFAVGLATFDTLQGAMTPVAIYAAINFIESQFVFPQVIGRTMTINPFLVFLSIAFWLWLWGPIGGFIAVPSLLIAYSLYNHLVVAPARAGSPRKVVEVF